MHEDHSLELSLIPSLPVQRALVIASGGDLAFSLAARNIKVLAVDTNPAQTALVRQKMTCPAEQLPALCHSGKVDRILRLGGPVAAFLLDWPRLQPRKIRRFLTNFTESLLHPAVRLIHGPQAAARLDRRAIRLLRTRFEAAMAAPGAAANPLLQVLLGKGFGPCLPEVWTPTAIAAWRARTHLITLQTTDATQALQECPANSLGLISLSNLPDALSQADWDHLLTQAATALQPGGFLIARSMLRETLTPLPPTSAGLFETRPNPATDQSPLCPVIWIGQKRPSPK
jgi:S-adenosylmethionine:diacylglycerol 3-amino-3-carboxypropyl transferase